jgi:uncharacterized integral membrane protein (TIGR00698 family)
MRAQWLPRRPDLPGLALAGIIGAISVALVKVLPKSPVLSDVLLAMVLGAFVLNTPLAGVFGLGSVGKEREPDRYASGTRFVGKWVLRLAIILMGLKVQTGIFGKGDVFVVFGVAAASIPSAFFVAHILGVLLGIRRPLADLLAGGTMICGASAVNAVAPVSGAHREEQGVAIAVVFLFSVVAMFTFRPLAHVLGLDENAAGLWSGLAVNDLASAVAVGAQMGEAGGVVATASKSARILLLGPVLVALSLLRRTPASEAGLRKSIVDALPRFLIGYVALAILRATGDRILQGNAAWNGLVAGNQLLVDLLMSTVSAGIGLHLSLKTVLGQSARAVVVGGGASACIAGVTLAMITCVSRGNVVAAVVVGATSLALSFAVYRAFANEAARARNVVQRLDAGNLITLEEATVVLTEAERKGPLDEKLLRRLLDQLSPSIGELIPARTSPLGHGEGCRWMTYWEGRSGWALVAVVREPGSTTPIHAHPHRLLGKAIEGTLEELRFADLGDHRYELSSRAVLAHEDLVETDGLATLHVVRAVGESPAIDLQLRGPEVGSPGRIVRPRGKLDVLDIAVGTSFEADEEIDARPGQSGDGAAAGRLPNEAA